MLESCVTEVVVGHNAECIEFLLNLFFVFVFWLQFYVACSYNINHSASSKDIFVNLNHFNVQKSVNPSGSLLSHECYNNW